MATAAILAAAYVGGKIVEGVGAGKVAESNVEAANIQAESAAQAQAAAQAQQDIENARAEALLQPSMQAQEAQLALLGQGGSDSAQQAAQDLTTSPLVAALNQQNQQNIEAQAAASGVSGGNLLSALQNANTAAIMQAGFGGLGQVAGQQQNAAQGFAGLGMQGLGLANQTQFALGNAQASGAIAQGQAAAIPWMTAGGIMGGIAQGGAFLTGAGAGAAASSGAASGVGAANGLGGTISSPMGFGSAVPLL